MLSSLNCWLTWRCNFYCEYCSARKLAKHAQGHTREASGQQWLEALNELPAATIDITGGEPFLHAGIYTIIARLDTKHALGITTNLSLVNVDELPRRPNTTWTISLHFSQYNAKFDFHDFLDNAIILRDKYAQVTVNIVATPDEMRRKNLATLKEFFDKKGFRFHVDPDMHHKYTPYQKKKLTPYLDNDRSLNGNTRPRQCTAGTTHFHVMPDGTVFRCYYHTRPLGNLFQESQKYQASTLICHVNCRSGCDLDKVEIQNVYSPKTYFLKSSCQNL